MKRLVLLGALLCSTTLWADPTTAPSTQMADPYRALLQRVPDTLSGDPKIKSFDVVGAIVHDGKTMGEFRFRKTEKGLTSVYIEYSERHIPMFFGVGSNMFQYDPANGVIRRFHNVQAQVSIEENDKELTLNANLGYAAKAATHPVETLSAKINFRSLMEHAATNLHTDSDGPLDVITGYTNKGGSAQFWMDTRREYPLIALVLSTKDGPLVVMRRTEVNSAVDEAGMSFPSDDQLKKLMPMSEPDAGFFSEAKWMTGFMLSAVYEAALIEPAARPKVEQKLGKIDWDARLKSDAKAAEAIHKLIGEQFPPEKH